MKYETKKFLKTENKKHFKNLVKLRLNETMKKIRNETKTAPCCTYQQANRHRALQH